MLIENPMPVKLTMTFEKGTISFSRLRSDAADEQVYELAQAINSVQAETVRRIKRIDLKKIVFV